MSQTEANMNGEQGFTMDDAPRSFLYRVLLEAGDFRGYVSVQAQNDDLARRQTAELATGLGATGYRIIQRALIVVKDVSDFADASRP